MKHRRGFVSNSSSDSFILATNKTAKQFEKWLLGVYNAIFETDEENLDRMMKINEINEEGVKIFEEEIKEFYDSEEDIHCDLSYIIEEAKEKNLIFLRIDSKESNSIPWKLQEILQDYNSFRMHWG